MCIRDSCRSSRHVAPVACSRPSRRAHGKGMSEVVWPRPTACAAAVQADLADERGESLVELVAADPSSARGQEERLRCRLREAGVTLQDVVSQRGDGAVVQRDLALLLLLARADENHMVAQ